MRKQLGPALDNGSLFKIMFPSCCCCCGTSASDAFETGFISFSPFYSGLSSLEGNGSTLGLADNQVSPCPRQPERRAPALRLRFQRDWEMAERDLIGQKINT